MPIYEYACTACDHRADILHGINDPGPNFCPSCGKEGTMKKVFAPPAIHYRGSGWAKKDRSATTSKARKADAKSDGDGGDKAPAKSDTGTTGGGAKAESTSSTGSSSSASSED
jgi:putative FmdB family regulatory protein